MHYIPLTEEEKEKILKEIGLTFEDLLTPIPQEERLKKELDIPFSLSEIELEKYWNNLMDKNLDFARFNTLKGAGAYRHFIPQTVKYLSSLPNFVTAYTPYQPELSQGILQALFEFQSFICELTDLEIANSSMYDGASSLAEAILMSIRLKKSFNVVVAESLNPHYFEVLKTYADPHDVNLINLPFDEKTGLADLNALEDILKSDRISSVVVSSPNFFGIIENLKSIGELVHKYSSLFIVNVSEAIALAILKYGKKVEADIVTGEAQSFGNSINFGGPHLGFFATKMEYARQMPGRIVGETIDAEGKRGFVMTLRSREQDIKREKATSNICSNHALNAIISSIYLSTLGSNGLKLVAKDNIFKAHYLFEGLISSKKFEPVFSNNGFFNEFLVISKLSYEGIKEKLFKVNTLPPFYIKDIQCPLNKKIKENSLLFAVTEVFSKCELDKIIEVLGG